MPSRLHGLLEVFKVVMIVFVVAIGIRYFVAQPFVVEGSSMEPDFHSGEYLLVEKLGYHFSEPKRGDVIVFKYPNNPVVNYIKRIVGLPGETVKIAGGKVFVNDVELQENYLSNGDKTKTLVSQSADAAYEVKLAQDQYFVMGDNRQHSSDSREWGPLAKHFIIGKSALVLYPKENFQAVASPKY